MQNESEPFDPVAAEVEMNDEIKDADAIDYLFQHSKIPFLTDLSDPLIAAIARCQILSEVFHSEVYKRVIEEIKLGRISRQRLGEKARVEALTGSQLLPTIKESLLTRNLTR